MQNILRTLDQAQGVQGLDEDYKDTFQVNLARNNSILTC